MSSASILFQKGRKEREKGQYEKRRAQVKSVKGKISSASDTNVQTINTQIDNIGTHLTNGVSGLQKVGELVDTFPGKKEKDSSSDSTLSSYSGNLDSEITA